MASTPKVLTEKSVIDQFLTRAVENVYPTREKLAELLASGKRISVYAGIDPTGPTLHLGHLIWLRKLAHLQKMGHRVIMLIGDFTAMIGDPTDKSATRKQLTREEVLANCKLYKEQASKFISFEGENPVELKFNSEWHAKMSFADVVELSSHFTVQQMLERDMFHNRTLWKIFCPYCQKENGLPPGVVEAEHKDGFSISGFVSPEIPCGHCGKLIDLTLQSNLVPPKKGEVRPKLNVVPPKPIYLHEFLYPLMQGYDSVAMEVDLEIGGNDQTFNMLAGRTLMREIKNKEKSVLTTKLLVDTTGKKMGKSEGNMVSFLDTPVDMYGKVMSWTDGMILPAFELLTDVSDEEISDMKSKMAVGENPMSFKRRLAKEIVRLLSSDKEADEAEAHFATVHQKGEKPEDIPEFPLKGSEMKLTDVLVESEIVSSKSEARRQIEQGGVKVDDEVVSSIEAMVKAGQLIQKGKRHFLKLV